MEKKIKDFKDLKSLLGKQNDSEKVTESKPDKEKVKDQNKPK